MARARHFRCSFCRKSHDQVEKLIAGPGVYICDACVALCNQIIDEPPRQAEPGAPPPRRRHRLDGLRQFLRPAMAR